MVRMTVWKGLSNNTANKTLPEGETTFMNKAMKLFLLMAFFETSAAFSEARLNSV